MITNFSLGCTILAKVSGCKSDCDTDECDK